jgi:hypothetical protein
MRRRTLFALIVTVIVALGGAAYAAGLYDGGAPTAGDLPGDNPVITTLQTAPAVPVVTLRAPVDVSKIHISGASLFGWALYDRDTRQTAGSKNYTTMHNTTESMIKAWIAADYLRLQTAAGKTPPTAVLDEITLMIIDSNDTMAQKYYALDGKDDVINRLIKICGLTSVVIRHHWWSYTQLTPADTVRYGTCVGDGRAAGPRWTKWLLDTMKRIRGGVQDQIGVQKQGGRWGIIDGLPTVLKPTVSWKNGWEAHEDGWHISCMGISDKWVLAVEMHVGSLGAGADACASVARQLVVTS